MVIKGYLRLETWDLSVKSESFYIHFANVINDFKIKTFTKMYVILYNFIFSKKIGNFWQLITNTWDFVCRKFR